MEKYFESHPLMQKAHEEEAHYTGFMGGSVPAAHIQFLQRCVDQINIQTERSEKAREEIMVGCILLTTSPFVLSSIRYTKEEYTPAIAEMAGALLYDREIALEKNASLQAAKATIDQVNIQTLRRRNISQPAL